ncbi:MAG: hypothetical protein LIP16_19590 [Clostridium sp.]|nr:hypothetical protein [Clostridium sp.]
MENKEMDKMERQAVIFAVETENGVVNRIGKAYIATPEIKFRGGEISWLGDKFKTSLHGKESKKS